MKKDKKITKHQIYLDERKEVKRKFKEWSIAIKERDAHKCAICGSILLLTSHHIIPRENKEFRFDLDNGICLCVKHHKYSFDISAHRNSFIFVCWLQQNRPEQFERLYNKWKFINNKNV